MKQKRFIISRKCDTEKCDPAKIITKSKKMQTPNANLKYGQLSLRRTPLGSALSVRLREVSVL